MTNRKNIYNTLPEGYVPPPVNVKKGNEISLLRQGSVTEITLDNKTFQVYDPHKIEKLLQMVERHDERMHSLAQECKQLRRSNAILEQNYNKLSNLVTKLQEQIKNAGLDRF